MDALDKSIRIIELYDTYQELLTEKQKIYIEYYYFDNLSISEISDNLDVSRNAVHDQIKRTVKKLEDLESNLKLKEKTLKRKKLIKKLKELKINDVDVIVEELEKVE
jgi:predicted DNA-binding protein YlxM (UPF0122 family)